MGKKQSKNETQRKEKLFLQSTWNLMVKIEINFSSDWSEKEKFK